MTPTQFALLTQNVIAYARASELRFHCDYESQESTRYACDGGYPCCAIATVHHLATAQDVCLAHYNRLERN